MKRTSIVQKLLAILASLAVTAEIVTATPSTTVWTPATIDIQSFGVLHVGVDNYFSVFRKAKDDTAPTALPTDGGLTIGILPFEKIQMEVGVDMLGPADYPLYFNAKIGSPENAWFKHSPGIGIGIFNAGTHTKNTLEGGNNRTNYNIGYGVIGKTIPYLGRITGGYYYGNDKVLLDGEGKKANKGYIVGFDRGFYQVKDASGEYNKFVLGIDYASGKNAIGGFGAALNYYFTKDISILVGPTWFNDEKINGKWKLTVQLDANIDFTTAKK